ncbi:hypothetical protein NL676_011673 [Syzygium grande]|nr:hypothetical protein NL676_011673 [Syzygium grande]
MRIARKAPARAKIRAPPPTADQLVGRFPLRRDCGSGEGRSKGEATGEEVKIEKDTFFSARLEGERSLKLRLLNRFQGLLRPVEGIAIGTKDSDL